MTLQNSLALVLLKKHPLTIKSRGALNAILKKPILILQQRHGVGNGLFQRFATVLVNFCLVFLAVGKTAGTTDATAGARHTFDEVGVEEVFAFFEEGYAAFFYAVAGAGLEVEVYVLFFETFGDRVGETAAAGEDSAEVGGVVEDAFVEGGDVYVAAVEERLEFFKSHSRVDVWLHGVLLDFEFLGGAWAYEDYAAGAFVFFDVF